MAKKLYVGGLSYQTSDDTLRAAFAQAGTVVSAVVIKDKFSGQSKGFGFVEMSTDEEADAAMTMWNDQVLDGRQVKVNVARPMEDRPPRRDNFSRGGFGGGRGGFGGGRGGNNNGGYGNRDRY